MRAIDIKIRKEIIQEIIKQETRGYTPIVELQIICENAEELFKQGYQKNMSVRTAMFLHCRN